MKLDLRARVRAMSAPPILRIAVPSPLRRCFDYFPPQHNERALFPGVAITDLPDNGAGTNRIKQNLQSLHKRVLGEQLVLDDPEITRSYDLFIAARTASTGTNIPVDCAGTLISTDPIRVDANGTVRAWMAVVAYLMMDYKFLYE